MRIRLAFLAVSVLVTGCTSARAGRSMDVEESSVVASESVPEASMPVSGPMDAGALGRGVHVNL